MANENPKSGVVDLKSAVDGKIQHVSLYSNQAEITRSYTFDVAAGLNQVNIYGLPSLPRLQKDSVRVEGKGSATIHDVTVTLVPIEHVSSTSETLQALQDEAERVSHSLTRAQNAISSLESYLKSFTASSVNANLLGEQIDNYEAVGERLDDRVMALKKEQAQLAKKIQEENHRIIVANAAQGDVVTRTKVIVGVFADVAGSVELVLIYVVTSASWDAAYDVRVSPGAKLKEKQAGTPMTIIYKAIVHQNTGEAWNDVPLTLETASPSYGVEIPSLDPWIITKHRPQRRYSLAYGGRGSAAPMMSAMLGSHYDPTVEDSSPEMDHREASVTSQGTINATFSVPGLVSVPCDGDPHTFTIANLELQAELSWVAVPRKDTKVHLKAQVVNTSEYTLLTGQASVFVDGSFIAKANMPAVNPQEKFDYSLGLDPSIRITYHPRIKALSQSGFYNKTATTVFTQRITVHNTKTIAVDNVKILDQIPVSEDADIVVKLDTPSLSVVSGGTVNKLKNTSSSGNAPVKVTAGVVAQWEVNPDEDAEPGRDGKINWLCAVPAQTKVNLVLKWEVTSPARQHVHGLDVSHAK